MIIRRLGPEEYFKLRKCKWLPFKRQPQPNSSIVLVAEEKGEIQGFLVAQLVLQTEPVWISPKKRGSTLLGRLYKLMKKELSSLSINMVSSHAASQDTASYLKRLGFKCKNAILYEKEL